MKFSHLPLIAVSLALFAGPEYVAADSPAGALSAAQQKRQAESEEVIRRQEQVFIATQALKEGEQLERDGDLKEARKKYAFAVANLGHSPATADLGNRAKTALVRVNFKLYEVAKQEGNTNDAFVVLKEILAVDPGNRRAADMLALLEENIKDGPVNAVLGNPAVNPNFVKKVEEVEGNFALADQYENTGQFEEAEELLERNIALDQYNVTSSQELRKINKKEQFILEEARRAMRDDRIEDVERKWANVPGPANVIDFSGNRTPLTKVPGFELKKKLDNIVLPEVVFNNASIEDAANFFNSRSQELDQQGEGISFVVRPEAAATAQRFDLRLTQVPLVQALRYATQKAGVKYKVEEFAVVIVPLTEETDVLLERSYNVPPNFFAAPQEDEPDTEETGFFRRRIVTPVVESSGARGAIDAKTQLEARGIEFPNNATAVYYPESGVLQVRNTQDQLEIIEAIALAQTEATYMVEVEVKLVEINQNDINELSFNYALDPSLPPMIDATDLFGLAPNQGGVPIGNPKASVNTALRGSQGFNVSSLDALIDPNAFPIPNVASIQGTLSNEFFNMVITSLAQKKSFDLLSAPSVRVENSGEATINVTRTFFYPVEFDPPETASQTVATFGDADADFGPPTVIPAFPSEFETRDLGVKLTIKPQIGADNKTIDLALFPEIVEFDGLIDYGTPISVSTPAGTTLLSNNEILQPVFDTRRIDTRVFVEDNHTVVLGGLMRDDVQIIDDKVPFLGDLPLIGRLFQAKAEQSIKTNLLIFVTCKIYLNNGELLNPPEIPPAILPGSSERLLGLEGLSQNN